MPAQLRVALCLLLVVLYGVSYTWLDRNMQERAVTLQAVPPLKLLQAVTGYFRQISSGMMFVQSSVFLGGIKACADKLKYESTLAHNLRTMTLLYPEFKDPYFFTNSFLAPISKYGAEQAAFIFKTGINALPDNFTLRLFDGANYFHNLDQANKAAKSFAKSAELENAPIMFARLAAIFSAHGGNLKAGLIMLHTMTKIEENETVRERYLEEITYFERAITIQNAVDLYTRKHGKPPENLEQLVPDYITKLPEMNEVRFVLVYTPPTVSLRRP